MENDDYKILVVDDNTNNIKLLVNLLTEKNYDVEYALNGQDALKLVDSEDFDLILLDIMMPEMDGFEVCKRIKKNAKKIDIPIIFITAKTDIESIEKAFDYGGLDYVSKPFNSSELIARVKTHVELKISKDKLKGVNQWLEEKVIERTKELKESNVELAKAKEELEVLDIAKTEFLNILSHEIRTPLNGIMGGMELLKISELPEETKDFISILDVSVNRLEEFSLKALDISQLQTKGADILNPIQLQLKQLLSGCIETLSEEIDKKDLNIDLSQLSDKIGFKGDSDFIRKCFNELFKNAIEYSPKYGAVKINFFEKDNEVFLMIENEGEGFPDKILHKSFQPFVLGQEQTDKIRGLGLNLVKLIMDAHTGDIKLSNSKKGGAIVSLRFKKHL